MKMNFSKDELAMVYQYAAGTKEETLAGLKEIVPVIRDRQTREIVESTIRKLDAIPEPECRRFIADTKQRFIGRSTWYFVDEFHLLLKEEQTAAYSAEIWKRFRKWGGIPTGATQNPKDLLSSPEIENILENSDFIYMLNQAAGDRKILAERLNISSEQLAYVTNSEPGHGLLFFNNVILPFADDFPKHTELYKLLTTKPSEVEHEERMG